MWRGPGLTVFMWLSSDSFGAAQVRDALALQSAYTDSRCDRWQGGKVNRREQRIVSPTGQGALNMSRSLGDPAYKQPHRLVSCEPTVKRIELTCVNQALDNDPCLAAYGTLWHLQF